VSTKHILRGVTSPTTSAEWAAALDVATSTRATLHHEGDLHSAASDLISFAHAGGTAAGVSLAGGEIHDLHDLDDADLLSADGEWLVSWSSQDGYWTGWLYERPAVRVAIDMAHDMRAAGLPDHPAIVRQQRKAWQTAAYRVADELLVNLHFVFVTPAFPDASRTDALTNDGDLTLAGRVWQEAHAASDPGVDASWLVADLAHDEDFNSWELTVRRYHARGRPEHIETVASGPSLSPGSGRADLRECGYGTIGPWVETDGYGHYGIIAVRSDLEHRGSPTTTMWTKRNSSSGRFTS